MTLAFAGQFFSSYCMEEEFVYEGNADREIYIPALYAVGSYKLSYKTRTDINLALGNYALGSKIQDLVRRELLDTSVFIVYDNDNVKFFEGDEKFEEITRRLNEHYDHCDKKRFLFIQYTGEYGKSPIENFGEEKELKRAQEILSRMKSEELLIMSETERDMETAI